MGKRTEKGKHADDGKKGGPKGFQACWEGKACREGGTSRTSATCPSSQSKKQPINCVYHLNWERGKVSVCVLHSSPHVDKDPKPSRWKPIKAWEKGAVTCRGTWGQEICLEIEDARTWDQTARRNSKEWKDPIDQKRLNPTKKAIGYFLTNS